MEFDILNEILTATVAQLFTDRKVHSSYFKASTEERNEIPTGMGANLSKSMNTFPYSSNSTGSSSSNPQTKESANSAKDLNKVSTVSGSEKESINTNNTRDQSRTGTSLNLNITDVVSWLATEGKKKLEEAMIRLKLDGSKITGKYLNGFIIEDLLHEKKSVKNELKLYDSNFLKVFMRAPSRGDKEPMRPLYMYYKNLKKAISKKGGPNAAHQNKEAGYSSAGTANTSGMSGYLSAGSATSDHGVKYGEKNLVNGKQEEEKKAYSSSGASSGKMDRSEITDKLKQLKGERSQLRTRLDEYQQEFQKTHNRRIRYTRDIAPMSAEFKRYKELKGEIAKLEASLATAN